MKKPDYFNKVTAERTGVELRTVKAVTQYFYRVGVKQNLSRATYRALFLKNFGTITISRYKLYREIEELIRKIRSYQSNERLTDKRKTTIITRLKEILRELLVQRNEIATENYNDVKTNRIPQVDPCGDEEPGEGDRRGLEPDSAGTG